MHGSRLPTPPTGLIRATGNLIDTRCPSDPGQRLVVADASADGMEPHSLSRFQSATPVDQGKNVAAEVGIAAKFAE